MKTVFAQRFRQLRLHRGLSAQQLAEQLGVSRKTIYDLEKGSEPHIRLFARICQYFQVDPDDLLYQKIC